jgi:hypothetical protein
VSGGAIFQEVLRILRGHELPDVTERDLLAALEAARPGPLPLLYEAGHEAGLDRPTLLARTAALYFLFTVGNLADDLADGDCDYLEDAARIAPGVQYLLHTLAFGELARAGIPADALARGARTLVASAAQQQLEVRTQAWTAARYRQIGDAIAGRQYAAYLGFLWHGTPLAARAEEIGQAAGFVGFVVADVVSRDARFGSMSADDQRRALGWAHDAMATLRAHPLRSVAAILAHAEVLGKEPT